MKLQLLSWAQNPSFDNKWDKVAFNNKVTSVIAWIWSEDNKFNADILNMDVDRNFLEGEVITSQRGMVSLEEAKAFADSQLKKQGFSV